MVHTENDSAAKGGCPMAGRSAAEHGSRAQGAWPPGPKVWLTGWGLLHQMSGDPLGQFRRWHARFGDLVHLHIRPQHLVLVMHPSLVRELLVDHHDHLTRWERARSVFAQMHGNSVLVAEGEEWKRKRKALNPAFSPAAVQSLLPSMGAVTQEAFLRWPKAEAGEQRWPVEEELTALTMDVIARVMFSCAMGEESRQAQHDLRVITEAANREFYIPSRFFPSWLPSQKRKRQAIGQLNAFIDKHIDARLCMDESQWPDDLLARLLHLHRSAPDAWPISAVHGECMTAFQAGHETVASTLIWWTWCMASNPHWQERVAQEVRSILPDERTLEGLKDESQWQSLLSAMPLLGASIQESMRLYPAAPMLMSRVNQQPIALGGYAFPAGTQFMIPLHVGQKDERWFAQPEAFNPERFLSSDGEASELSKAPRGAWMAFGTGPRVCLGQHLATAEMSLVAALLLQRWRLTAPKGMRAPAPLLHVTLRPQRPLELSISARD